MADRYLVASGNWSNTAIWGTVVNGSGGASVPGSGDRVYLSPLSSGTYTVTLDMNISVISMNIQKGSLNANGFDVICTQLGHSTSSLNMGSGTWRCVSFRSQSGTLTAGTSRLIIDLNGSIQRNLQTPTGQWLNSVEVITDISALNRGILIYNANVISLVMKRSTGVVSHDVMFAPTNTTLTVGRIILKGIDSSNPLNILAWTGSGSNTGTIALSSGQIIAAQYLSLDRVSSTGIGKRYAESSTGVNSTGWTLSPAPKVNTLIDNFSGSVINSTLWGAFSGAGGSLIQSGGELFLSGSSASSSALLSSNDQYLLEGSYSVFKLNTAGLGATGRGRFYISNAQQQYGFTPRRNIPDIYMEFTQTTVSFSIISSTTSTTSPTTIGPNDIYWRVREDSGVIYFDKSANGVVFTNATSFNLTSNNVDPSQITARPQFNYLQSGAGFFAIDDFNVDLEPTAEFTSNATSGFTPTTVNFTDQSNFTPTSWSWNFGDSTTSTVQNPTKTYSLPGTYTVSLTSSNSSYTRSVTKLGYITVSPNIYSRIISGSLMFGGGLTRRLLASRSISGGLVFGGSVRSVLLRDVESIQDKRYLYKVYDETGSYIETWSDVISELSYTHEINTIGSTTEIELARNSDTVGFSTAPLLTESDQPILTEDDFDLLADIESKNQIGSGSSVEYNNRVDIVAFYGSVEPLLTEDDEPITTEDDEDLLADIGAPNGRVIFTGFISEINSRYGNSETTLVQLTSYGWDLGQYPITDNLGNTTVTFNSQDPSNIAKSAVDKFVADSAPYDTYTYRDANSISNTGTVVSYTFRANTYEDVLGKTLELMPANWYYRVGLGDNLVYYKERSALPQHLFYLGKHIKALDLKGSIINATNRVLFTGGGDPALYIDRSEAPADRTRRSLSLLSDNRVTVLDSAEVITEGQIEEGNKRQYRTTIEILTRQYDIESISVGETVGFKNFGNYVDALVMQIVGLSYSPDSVQLQLETKPPTINKRLADIQRNLTVTENQNIPDSPS